MNRWMNGTISHSHSIKPHIPQTSLQRLAEGGRKALVSVPGGDPSQVQLGSGLDPGPAARRKLLGDRLLIHVEEVTEQQASNQSEHALSCDAKVCISSRGLPRGDL